MVILFLIGVLRKVEKKNLRIPFRPKTCGNEATAFVTAMNKLIADMETSYNQRMRQAKAAKDRKKGG